MTTPAYLKSTCGAYCMISECRQAVKKNAVTGRWYITIGHPGFNSPTNNGHGYQTKERARTAVRHYERRYTGPNPIGQGGRS